MTESVDPNRGFLTRAHKYLAIAGGIYAGLVLLLAVPWIQRHAVYVNALRLPWGADFDAPEKYGLAVNKTFNLHLNTPDNETLGAWFVMSEDYYKTIPSTERLRSEDQMLHAIQNYPTILFLHGNAATRAFHVRVQYYSTFTSRLGVNVLAIDYRGYGDSTGVPSEDGLITDGRAAFDWLVERGAAPEDILIVGHSLGTGVSGGLAARLSNDKVDYKGVVLLSPFSSITELLSTYRILGLVPLMSPLSVIPFAANFIPWALIHKFDTIHVTPDITGEIMIAHAENDWDIPYTHSDALFDALLEPHLPSVPADYDALKPPSLDKFTEVQGIIAERKAKKAEVVKTTVMKHFGEVKEFDDEGRSVTYVKMHTGWHDYVGTQETMQDIIREKFYTKQK